MCAIARGRASSLVVISTAGESGPCSAWLSRSTATTNGSACVVGDDQDLGRAGEQVDADLAEQLPLGLGDVGVARTGDAGRPGRWSRCRWPARPWPARRRAGRSRRRRPATSRRSWPPGSRRGSAACRPRPARRRRPWPSRWSCGPRRSAGSDHRARRRPRPRSGRSSAPGARPGSVSTSKSVSDARWAWAKRRTWACTNSMSRMTCSRDAGRRCRRSARPTAGTTPGSSCRTSPSTGGPPRRRGRGHRRGRRGRSSRPSRLPPDSDSADTAVFR